MTSPEEVKQLQQVMICLTQLDTSVEEFDTAVANALESISEAIMAIRAMVRELIPTYLNA